MMTIYSLIDDIGARGEHGVSLHIALSDGQHILFDMGQGERLKHNAEAFGIDLNEVQIAVISHGHYDHGGGLATFMTTNAHAPIYIHRRAFDKHYSIREDGKHFIGLVCPQDRNRLVLCGDMVRINDHITLFSDVHGKRLMPTDNQRLLGNDGVTMDDFGHEMNMIIRDGDISVLVMGRLFRSGYEKMSVIVNLYIQGTLLLIAGFLPFIAALVNICESPTFVGFLMTVGLLFYASIYVVGFIWLLRQKICLCESVFPQKVVA